MSILYKDSLVEDVQVTILTLLHSKWYSKKDTVGAKNKPNPAAERWSPRMTKPFDEMNSIASNLLLHLTSSMRFEGPLNGNADVCSECMICRKVITVKGVTFPFSHRLLDYVPYMSTATRFVFLYRFLQTRF